LVEGRLLGCFGPVKRRLRDAVAVAVAVAVVESERRGIAPPLRIANLALLRM